jgi:predicted ArsR family transcriptional regulator
MLPRLDKRFWASTRGRLILLLRHGSRTVNELAEAVGLTANAVRAHLTALERDALVRQSGTRPGTRKPTILYDLTPEAEQLFPKVYGPVLRHFLDVLKERTTPKKLEEIARTVGRRMAGHYRAAVQTGKPLDRAAQAVTVLRELGGFCESEGQDGRVVLRCSDCPLALVATGHPEVCQLMETVLSDVLAIPVRQRCQPGPPPRCSFEFDSAAD